MRKQHWRQQTKGIATDTPQRNAMERGVKANYSYLQFYNMAFLIQ